MPLFVVESLLSIRVSNTPLIVCISSGYSIFKQVNLGCLFFFNGVSVTFRSQLISERIAGRLIFLFIDANDFYYLRSLIKLLKEELQELLSSWLISFTTRLVQSNSVCARGVYTHKHGFGWVVEIQPVQFQIKWPHVE